MDDPFRWNVLWKALILPPLAPIVVAFIGLLILQRKPRAGRTLVALGIGTLTALSLPVIAVLLVRIVDDSPALDVAAARTAQAIVILGGGIRPRAPEYGGDTMGRLTLERVRYGARVARLTGLPVLVTGGRFNAEDATEAAVMKAALQDEYGVAVRWAEEGSRNTHENAQMSAAMLRADGVSRIVLVAHGFDIPRASAEFAAEGIGTVPAPTGIPGSTRITPLDFVPSAAALQASYYALYELYANAWRRIKSFSRRRRAIRGRGVTRRFNRTCGDTRCRRR